MKMSRKEYYELPIIIVVQYGMSMLSLSSISRDTLVPLKLVAKVTTILDPRGIRPSKIDAIYFDINGINVSL